MSVFKKFNSFPAFLFTQFMGVFNDNAFKIVISFMAINQFDGDSDKKNFYLSLAAIMSIIPFVLFAGYAGYVSDRFHKTRVLLLTKAFEIVAMTVALILFISTQSLALFLIALFLMGAQSAFFSPAKYSIIPEIVPKNRITSANSLLTMLTYMAIIFGTVTGGMLYQQFSFQPIFIGLFLVGFAVVGTITALAIPHSPYAGDKNSKFNINPLNQVFKALPYIKNNRPLRYAVIGSFLFWTLSGFLYFCLLLLGKDVLNVTETKASALFSILGIGIALGGFLAGLKAGERTRAFLCPVGAMMLATGCMMIKGVDHYASAAWLMVYIGVGCGLFIVPVVTLLQKATAPERRGQIIATSSFFDIGGVVVASMLNYVIHGKLEIAPDDSAAIVGTGVFIALLISMMVYRDFYRNVWRSVIAGLLFVRYKVNVLGEVPEHKRGMLVVSNHQSYLDGVLLAWLLPRGTRFMVLPSMFDKPIIGKVLKKAGAIPFGGTVGQNKRGIEMTRDVLKNGGIVCVFPEGTITRTGHLRPFRRGIEVMAEGLNIDILPIYIHGLFGSNFSFSGQRFFGKAVSLGRRRVTIKIGEFLPADQKSWQIRREIALLGSQAFRAHVPEHTSLATRFLNKAIHCPFKEIATDSTGTRLNYMKLAVGARLLGKHLEKTAPQEEVIGILMPGTVAAVLCNLAAAFTGRTVVNLNFSLGKEVMENAISQAGIKRVVTSKLFLKKLDLQMDVPFVYLEDFRKTVSGGQRLKTLLAFWLMPNPLLRRRWLAGQAVDHTAIIQFSSGSTAEPKGVCLSDRQILCNVAGFSDLMLQVPKYPILGVLPLFHAFGYTVSQWYSLLSGTRVFFHPNPLEYKTVAEHINKENIGIVVATPTFASGYARSAELPSVRLVVCGGEKLSPKMAATIQAKLPKAHVLEGYGASELGPVVAVNTPDYKSRYITQPGSKPGSVGLPIPGVAIKIIDIDTKDVKAPNEEGLVLVHSPARMGGYLHKEELTKEVLYKDWYNTGDIGKLDSDGFLFLTDRQSRFSKIGGEMVPHGKIEQELQQILDHQDVVVVPDEQDKLHVLYVDERPAKELAEALKQTTLPPLWQPKPINYHQVEELPRFATGKLDLKACKKLVA